MQHAADERRARSHALAALDTTPPVLKHVSVTGNVNAQLPGQSVGAEIKLTDDLSGIVYYYIEFRSPTAGSTQFVYRTKTVPYPSTAVSSTLTVGAPSSFTRFSEPGTWVADYLYAEDAAGNYVYYNEAQLAALGPTTFQVTNTGGYDIVPPTLASGTITTTTVKLSKPPKGTVVGTPPYVSASVSVTDAGNGTISGTNWGYLTFCLPNGSGGCTDTFSMRGQTNRSGLVANTLIVGGQLRADQTPGSYQIYFVQLTDIAGNYSYHYSTDFGGDYDFHDYFPVTTVFVNQ
jgi:hypothetical protein